MRPVHQQSWHCGTPKRLSRHECMDRSAGWPAGGRYTKAVETGRCCDSGDTMTGLRCYGVQTDQRQSTSRPRQVCSKSQQYACVHGARVLLGARRRRSKTDVQQRAGVRYARAGLLNESRSLPKLTVVAAEDGTVLMMLRLRSRRHVMSACLPLFFILPSRPVVKVCSGDDGGGNNKLGH